MFNLFFLHSTFFRNWIQYSRIQLTVVPWYQQNSRVNPLVESYSFWWYFEGTRLRFIWVFLFGKLVLILKQSDAVISKRFTFTSLSRYLFKILITWSVMWFRPVYQWKFNLVLNSKSSPNILLWNFDIITWNDFWWYQTNWKSCTWNVDRKPIWWFRDTSWRCDFLSRITSLSHNVSKTAKPITRSLAGYYFGPIMRNIYSFLYQDGFQLWRFTNRTVHGFMDGPDVRYKTHKVIWFSWLQN